MGCCRIFFIIFDERKYPVFKGEKMLLYSTIFMLFKLQ